MNEFALARVIHVLAVVLWIGGVAMITTVVIPIIRKSRSDVDSVELFEAIEKIIRCKAVMFVLLGSRAVVPTSPFRQARANETAKDIHVRADFPHDHAYPEFVDHRQIGGGQSRLVSNLILERTILDKAD